MVAALAPLEEVCQDLGSQAREEDETEDGMFGGMNVLYDSKGYEYPMDDYGQIYVLLEAKPTDAGVIEEETNKSTKN